MAQDIYDEAKRLLEHARKPLPVANAERAVIEAAKRAKRTLKECSRVTAGGSDEEIDSLVAAVEALEAEEE